MAQAIDSKEDGAVREPPPLKQSRVLHARRETVFKAWSTAEHVKNWFAPEGCAALDVAVEMRVGGKFDLDMRSPDGTVHRLRGTFVEIVPNTRLVIDMRIADSADAPIFDAYTEIDLSDALGGTQMNVVQRYTIRDLSKAWMVAGAPQGWSSTLDNLEREVVRMQGAADTGTHSVAHATFHLERRYDAPVARVWLALTDATAKQKWFSGPADRWTPLERHMDVRVGGKERLKGRWEGGMVSTFDAVYHDIVPNERLVYSYEMYLDDKKISHGSKAPAICSTRSACRWRARPPSSRHRHCRPRRSQNWRGRSTARRPSRRSLPARPCGASASTP
jgi:uncharacterized protein YndB with AHSA1/START domain